MGIEGRLTVAMPKGRIFSDALTLLEEAGLNLPRELAEDSRKLMVEVPAEDLSFLLVKPVDVPTCVEHGAADLGVAGKDVLMEEDRDVYELLDLQISPCRLSLAGTPDWQPVLNPKVATKYPRIANRWFREQGQQVEVICLNGSVELAPLTGLADRIVDIVSTGQTLRENGLVELEEITRVTSRLIANRASYRLKSRRIDRLYERLARVVMGKGDCDDRGGPSGAVVHTSESG
ncbi:ATP phosphoribosyltransferase [Kroppenstedtia eburnea]|uniref:ATP phosphoribosyltransferase n=1 Tax=Kroppenstedtia eburnea TaxID=714067 RepID=A0A1N7JWS7_9BACL|nr:ATP phosphoribosyltransferase [Kroppenstedtia eburnea]QKI83407.1 ATP phosphoribosyltransferase [Kroppenstedtia eburnea]SIS53654.1 ATP phosphoribosyltransferase [Kroppenstedtia eburnea]